jgi:uncharacterized protein
MELAGQRVLAIDRAAVWKALNDPQILKASIPGCEAIEKTGDNEYAVTIAAALGPVRARFRGKLRVEDIVAPQSYTLRFEGDGGPAGLAKGSARVTLAANDGGTVLDYKVRAQVSGRIAQVGSRLVDSAALKLADEFFSAFQKQVAPQAVAATPEREPVPIGRYIAMAVILAALVASIAYTLR